MTNSENFYLKMLIRMVLRRIKDRIMTEDEGVKYLQSYIQRKIL